MRSNVCPSEDMGAWVTVSDNCTPDPATCNYSVQEEQVACDGNQVGAITYKREQNCPNPYGSPVDSGWFEISRSCQPAPPTCQPSTQQRQLSCQPHQSGSIVQTMTTVCSDPYGQPSETAWVTTSNTCVQDPPTCTSTSRQKTEGCGTNEVGSKLYQADDTCPDPYGSNVNGEWYLVTNSCQPAPATCHESVETKTGSCGEHQVGHITYTETLTCANPYTNAVSSGWIATSNTCQPAPATCATSTIQRTLSCLEGYTGSITQQQTSSCPDPYGQPIFGQWVEIQNLCKQEITNVQNVTSPVSPTSVIEIPTPAPVMQPEPVTAQTESVPMQTTTTTTESKPSSTTETKVETKTEAKSESSANTSEQKETKSESGGKIDVPKGKELVPGFGLVMSLDILNAPAIMQEQTLAIALDYTQELPNDIRGQQGFFLELITNSYVGDSFRNRNDWLWGNLRRHNDIQPCYSCN